MCASSWRMVSARRSTSGSGDLATEHVDLGDGHAAGVLHGAGVVLRREDLVVLLERVRRVELVLEELEADLGEVDDVVGVDVLEERAARVHPELDRPTAALDRVGDADVGAGDERGDVGGEHRGRREGPRRESGAVPVAGGRRLRGGGDGADRPVGGCRDGEREGGLEVGLLEHREDAARVGDLELRVEVDLAVDRVDEPVHPLARVRVERGGLDHELVLGSETWQRDPRVRPAGRRVEGGAVEGDRLDRLADEVDERLGTRRGVEPHRAPRREGRRTGGEVEDDVVRVDREQVGAGRRLLAGEVLAGCRRGHEGAPAGSGARHCPVCGDAPGRRSCSHGAAAREDAAGAFRPR